MLVKEIAHLLETNISNKTSDQIVTDDLLYGIALVCFPELQTAMENVATKQVTTPCLGYFSELDSIGVLSVAFLLYGLPRLLKHRS